MLKLRLLMLRDDEIFVDNLVDLINKHSAAVMRQVELL